MSRMLIRTSAIVAAFILQLAARQQAEAQTSPILGQLGAQFSEDGTSIQFRVFAGSALRVELFVFDKPQGQDEKVRIPMTKTDATGVWSITTPVPSLRTKGVTGTVYYGYRCWGPNWTFDASWTKGSMIGFKSDVDDSGNRYNPNKLLIDPYAREVSHDPTTPDQLDGTIYNSGDQRLVDTGTRAPKGIVLPRTLTTPVIPASKPTRSFKDEIIYEVHVRGLTKADASIAPEKQGTYAGAAEKVPYLKSLGVTAVEFLPLQEADNDANDVRKDQANYWGYDPYNYFSPDRRYASNKDPGGPTSEFKAMVQAFHAAGIKVYIDMVYNHTAEGGTAPGDGATAQLLSWRGFDSPTYYELASNHAFFVQTNDVPGANVNTANEVTRQEIIDALSYWKDVLGVDGYRFDLGAILGNTQSENGFSFDKLDPKNVLNRAVNELPVRPAAGGEGVDLIAEPWGLDIDHQGDFPLGWSEWNGMYRDTVRQTQNKLGIADVPLAQLTTRIAGSSDLFQNNKRKPWNSVNFVVCHDGFTLRDLYSFPGPTNQQLTFPKGPSDGGEDDSSWDHDNVPEDQRQAARTGMALLMLSAGVPMIAGGDELYRTQFGNTNPHNLDTEPEYLHYVPTPPDSGHLLKFTQRLFAFRTAHPALRPADFFLGQPRPGSNLKDITWLSDSGQEADQNYLANPINHFLAYRLDASASPGGIASIYVAYNSWSGDVNAQLPTNVPGKTWFRVADTANWMEAQNNFKDSGQEDALNGNQYTVHARSLLLLIEK